MKQNHYIYKKKPYVPPEIEVTWIDNEGILGDSFTVDVDDVESGDEGGGGGFIEIEEPDDNTSKSTHSYFKYEYDF